MNDLAENWQLAQTAFAGKIRTFARNSAYRIPGFDEEDVEQELLIVLYECVVHYNPDRGARFNSYFQGSAKNRIITLIRHFETKSRKGEIAYLEDEDVRRAVEMSSLQHSAEAIAMMHIDIFERTTPALLEEWINAATG